MMSRASWHFGRCPTSSGIPVRPGGRASPDQVGGRQTGPLRVTLVQPVLARRAVQGRINQITGVVLTGLGVLLATDI